MNFLSKKWVLWAIVLAGIFILGQGVALYLSLQSYISAGQGVSMAGWVVLLAWLCWGFWLKRTLPWVRKTAVVVLGTLAALLITGLRFFIGKPPGAETWTYGFYVARFGIGAMGYEGTAIGLFGAWAMAVAFLVGLALIRLVLSPGHAVLGVARTLVDEAIRMKVALVFIIVMVLVVPILPFVLDPKERLQYRIQSFLSYSLTLSALLLSLMTIFLACGTITGELNKRQIFLTMSKPVSRGQYLLGKWLGMALLNLLLLSVAGGATYVFARMLERQPAREFADRAAVQEQVLVARAVVAPTPPADMNMPELFVQRFRQLYAEDPSPYGGPGLDMNKPEVLQKAVDELTPKQKKSIQTAIIAKWHTIKPRDGQTYRFLGLDNALKYTQVVQLRFKASSSSEQPDGKMHLAMKLNGRPFPMVEGVQRPVLVDSTNFNVMYLPVSEIGPDSNITLEIRNENLDDPEQTFPASITFDPGEGLQVLYRVTAFEDNLLRALTLIWLRLAFLGVLGLMAGAFLGFPVACLLSLMVFFSSIAKGFLVESLGYYTTLAPKEAGAWDSIVSVFMGFFANLFTGQVWNALKIPIRLLGETFVAIVPSFSDFDPVPMLADGRVVPVEMLTQGVLWIGVISAGACGLIAWFIFRRRELARVTV